MSTQVLPADRRKANRFNDIRRRALDRPAQSRENKRLAGTFLDGPGSHSIRRAPSTRTCDSPMTDEFSAGPVPDGDWRAISRPLDRPVRLAVLISGGGTTLTNFLKQIETGKLSAEVALVIASRADCGGVERARRAGLRCEIVERKNFPGVIPFSTAIFQLCREARVDLVTLAGFLSLIEVPDDFAFRVMNIHPALIPAFCGKGFYGHRVHEAVLERGARVSGCTVHFADNHYDHGPIIVQQTVDVLDGDTADTLAARVFSAECQAYPEAIRLYAAGRLEVSGRRVRVRPE